LPQLIFPRIFPLIIYTDGSAKERGTLNAAAGYSVVSNDIPEINSKVRLVGVPDNNKAELNGIITAILKVHPDHPIIIVSDSKNSKRATEHTITVHKLGLLETERDQLRRSFHTEKKMLNLILENKAPVTVRWVKSHTKKTDSDSLGNAWADREADQATRLPLRETNFGKLTLFPYALYHEGHIVESDPRADLHQFHHLLATWRWLKEPTAGALLRTPNANCELLFNHLGMHKFRRQFPSPPENTWRKRNVQTLTNTLPLYQFECETNPNFMARTQQDNAHAAC